MLYNTRLFADYHQIHLSDEGSTTDLSEVWGTEEAEATQLAVDDDAMAIGTTVNVHIAVTVQVLDRAPDDDSGDFDHVAEASLHVPSGRLVVMGCSDYLPDAHRVEVPAGWVRVRISRGNLPAAWHADIESGNDPATTEQVRAQLWPAEPTGTRLFKRWQPE